MTLRLAFAYVAIFFWMGAYLPYWPVWLADRGMSPSEIGILLGVSPWTRVIASPLAGRWADRHGRPDRLATVLSLAFVVAMASFALVSDFVGLLLIMITVGLLHAPLVPLVDGLTIAAEAEGRLRYGPVRLWGSASFIAASWVGGVLLELHGEAVVLWILVGAAAASVVGACLLPAKLGGAISADPEPSEGPRASPSVTAGAGAVASTEPEHPFSARTWPFVGFLVVTALLHAGHAVLYAFGTKHWIANGHDASTAGFLWAESVLAEIVLFAYAARVNRWLTPRHLWILAGGAAVVRWAVLATTVALPWLVITQALHAFTYAALHLGAMAYIRQRIPANARARATTLYAGAATGLALGIALPLAGELYDHMAGGAYWVMSGLSLLGVLVALGLRDPPAGASA